MRVVVAGNWLAIEAYGINRLEECQTARTHTYPMYSDTQFCKDREGTDGVKKKKKRNIIVMNITIICHLLKS